MSHENNEDLWLGCCLGYRIGKYLSEKPGNDLGELIDVLKQIASGEFTLGDPGESAAKFAQWKDISQSIGHAGMRADKNLSQRALDQLSSQRDE